MLVLGCWCFSSSAAPGWVTFGNNNSSRIIDGTTGLPVAITNGVKAALYWSPNGSNNFVQLGAAAVVGNPVPGIVADGTRVTGPETTGGSVAQFQIRAWGGGFLTFEQAVTNGSGNLIGQSQIVTAKTGNPGGDPPTPPTSLFPYGLNSFTLGTNGLLILTLNCSTNKTVACGTVWDFDPPTYSDNCSDSNVTIIVTSTITNGSCPQVITRTWMASDNCGQSNTCSQVVTVVDTNPPSMTCAPSKTVSCDSVWTFDPPTAVSDACSGTNVIVTVVSTLTNGVCPRDVTRTWRATDGCGNTNLCSQTVSIVDTTPPTIVGCPTPKTVVCGSNWHFDTPTAFDVCSPPVDRLIIDITNGTCPQVITRTWFFSDQCQNTNKCSQDVTLIDTTPPTITCATNKTVACGDVWNFDSPTASDKCSGTNVTISVFSTVTNGTCPQLITRTWIATDMCSNSSSCRQTVSITCAGVGNPGIGVTKFCPSNAVPPGGLLVFTGVVTNTGDTLLTNVLVFNDQPVSNTLVFGPTSLAPGESANFSGSYFVVSCSCGPFADTLTAIGSSPCGGSVTSFASSSCPGTNSYTMPGDFNGDGIVDQGELNMVLTNYFKTATLNMTHPEKLPGGRFQFVLTNAGGWTFTVLASTNLVTWTNLPDPATAVIQFYDPAAATNAPSRFYRLRYP
jgi:hypothetical protein